MYKNWILGIGFSALASAAIAIAVFGYSLRFSDKTVPGGVPIRESQSLAEATGPLFVNPDNPRYFTDGTRINGKYRAIYLTGSHTWCNLIDCGYVDPPPPFDYDGYLDFLVVNNHNFIRLWRIENTKGGEDLDEYWHVQTPYQRTGPGLALDGKPKFDLTKFDQSYFDRLRSRIIAAGSRGIYVSVMLFDGFSVETQSEGHYPWPGHPYHKDNNINGVNGDLDGDGQGEEVDQLLSPEILALQESYVRKVIDTVNDLDNVLYEISNESKADSNSKDWQYSMVNFIKAYEKTKGKRHPVGLTVERFCVNNNELYTSPADWISPCFVIDDPAVADGSKVILGDTDHPCGYCGDLQFVWKSLTRGYNPIYMDPYRGPLMDRGILRNYNPLNPNDVSVRKNMGYTLAYAQRMDLASMTPQSDLCSTGYCLANAVPIGAEYLVYLPDGGTVNVNLSSASGPLLIEWFNPANGTVAGTDTTTGGATRSFTAPYSGDAVLYIYAQVPATQTPTNTSIPPTATRMNTAVPSTATLTRTNVPPVPTATRTNTPQVPTLTRTSTHSPQPQPATATHGFSTAAPTDVLLFPTLTSTFLGGSTVTNTAVTETNTSIVGTEQGQPASSTPALPGSDPSRGLMNFIIPALICAAIIGTFLFILWISRLLRQSAR